MNTNEHLLPPDVEENEELTLNERRDWENFDGLAPAFVTTSGRQTKEKTDDSNEHLMPVLE